MKISLFATACGDIELQPKVLLMRFSHVALFCACLAVEGGCSSMRYTTTLDPRPAPAAKINQAYTLASVSVLSSTAQQVLRQTATELVLLYPDQYPDISYEQLQENSALVEQVICKAVQGKAQNLYPELFGESRQTIPLHMGVDVKLHRKDANIILGIPYLNLLLSMVPIPSRRTEEYQVWLRPPAKVKDTVSQDPDIQFTRVNVRWRTYIGPLGALPVPGPSARPKTPAESRAGRINSLDLTLESLAGSVIAALNELDPGELATAQTVKTDPVARPLADAHSDVAGHAGPVPVPARYSHKGATAAILTFDTHAGLSADEVALLADRFAVELDRTDTYKLVPRSKMKEILDLQAFSTACSSVDCAVEAGQQLGVEYMIYGSIGRIGSLFTMNIYLASVEKGAVVAGPTMYYSGQIEGLLTEGMAQAVERLLQAVVSKGDAAAP